MITVKYRSWFNAAPSRLSGMPSKTPYRWPSYRPKGLCSNDLAFRGLDDGLCSSGKKERQHDAARNRGSEYTREVWAHSLIDQVISLVFLFRHDSRDAGGNWHRGDPGGADQRIDLLREEDIHDLCGEPA